MTNTDFGNDVQSLIGLVDYQEGSVVSRPLINKSSGTVTLFAFDEKQSLSEHTTPYDALVLVVDGKLDVTIEGKVHRVAEGEVLLMPANKAHSLHASERSKMLLTMIH